MKTILKDAESKMQKALDRLDYEYSTIRAGRANPAVLEKVSVDYYGAMTPINQMAAVSVAEARILVIQPWDISTLKAIEKAILNSDIGITPTNENAEKTSASPSRSTAKNARLLSGMLDGKQWTR